MKLSIDIDAAQAAFIRAYQLRHGLKSRSAVVLRALRTLALHEAQTDLAIAYAASSRYDAAIARSVGSTASDGLTHYAW